MTNILLLARLNSFCWPHINWPHILPNASHWTQPSELYLIGYFMNTNDVSKLSLWPMICDAKTVTRSSHQFQTTPQHDESWLPTHAIVMKSSYIGILYIWRIGWCTSFAEFDIFKTLQGQKNFIQKYIQNLFKNIF